MVRGCSGKCQSGRTGLGKETYRKMTQIIKYKNCNIPILLIFLLDFGIRKAYGKHGVNHDI